MYLLLLLLSCILSLLFITILNIKSNLYQVLTFGLIMTILTSFYITIKHNIKYDTIARNKLLNAYINNTAVNNVATNNDVINNVTATNNTATNDCNCNYSYDKIIPLSKYNPRDCVNDKSCIIQPNNQNLFPKNPNKQNCINCGRILDLTNNPVTEDFRFGCESDCTLCDDLTNNAVNKNTCIHCKNNILPEANGKLKDLPTNYHQL